VARPFRKRGAGYAVSLSDDERAMLAELCWQSRALLEAEDPSTDPAVARLFPPAYQDDPLQNLEFESALGDTPRNGKLDAIATVERTARATELSEDELLDWMKVVNDARLVLGTRIEITEQATQRDFPPDHPDHESFGVYVYLTWLEDRILRALGDPPTEPSVGGGD
jgi:Domain of unknown function (DUF2017)